MSSISTLAQLQGLKRAELQSLCKENSLKANGKNQELIESLVNYLQLTDGLNGNQTPAPSKESSSGKSAKKTTTISKANSTIEAEGANFMKESGNTAVSAHAGSSTQPAPLDPRIQALLDSLVSDVASLKEELAISSARIVELERSAPSSTGETRQSIKDDIREASAILDAKLSTEVERLESDINNLKRESARRIEGLEQQCDDELQKRLLVDNKVVELKSKVIELERVQTEIVQDVGSKVEEGHKRAEQVEQGLTERIRELELVNEAKEAEKEQQKEKEEEVTQSAQAARSLMSPLQLRTAAAVNFASPTLSDAPPTRSLVSFDSPVGSPGPQVQSTPRRASFAPVASHKATPFRFGSTTSAAPTPVSALPPHMVNNTFRNSPRSPRSSGASAPTHSIQPESPAAPVPNASLGKRARDSDASNLSVGLETVVSPARDGETPGRPTPGFFSAPTSTRKEDGHSRKKLRMSIRGDDDTFEDSMHGGVGVLAPGQEEEEDDDDEDDPEIENSNDSVRDYLMPTKTGESPTTTFRPAASVSTSDPSFFSAPVSPARSTPGRRSVGQINENQRPSSNAVPRKSLPVSNLPFPLVSPFANKTRPMTSFGTPATTTLGNLSNQHFTTLLKSTSKSASKASTASSSSKQRLLPPRTPPASRTLFGTERFPFSDGFEEESKFDDDFETAEEDNTESEQTWSRFGGGAFSRV
ncbi:hypothetical protein JCM3765_001460 [Sporobolomyces pararoseus]